MLYYQRGAEGDNVPETIIGRGPTTEPLVVEVSSNLREGHLCDLHTGHRCIFPQHLQPQVRKQFGRCVNAYIHTSSFISQACNTFQRQLGHLLMLEFLFTKSTKCPVVEVMKVRMLVSVSVSVES